MKRINRDSKAIVLIVFLALIVGGLYVLDTRYYPPILMYHSVDEKWTETKLSVSPKDFRAQMKFLRDKRYNVISLEKLADIIKNKRHMPRHTVVVTFDDGNENNYTNAFPVLREYKIPATIFLVSDWIGKKNFLNVAQIREMYRYKIKFGSHTKTHANLSELSGKRLEDEIIISKRDIDAILDEPVNTFCYPFGGKNPKAKEIISAKVYEAACITFPRDDSIKLDRYELKRIKISSGPHNLLVFRMKISGYYTWLKAHRWKKKK